MESVFTSIARILNRIEEIKSRFGVYTYSSSNRSSANFDNTLRTEEQNHGKTLKNSLETGRNAGLNDSVPIESTKKTISSYSKFDFLNNQGSGADFEEGSSEIMGDKSSSHLIDPEISTGKLINEKPGKESNSSIFKQLDDAVKLASEKYGLPEQLIKAVIEQESGFDPWAVSSKGALGLMQLMPSTAEILGVKNPFDIYENILGGAGYLKVLLDRYGGDLNKALAAYNAGPMKVKDNVPQIPETRKFIRSVIDSYEKFMSFSEGDEF